MVQGGQGYAKLGAAQPLHVASIGSRVGMGRGKGSPVRAV